MGADDRRDIDERWEETSTILGEVDELCKENQDEQRIRNCKELKKQAQNMLEETVGNVQGLIKDYISQTDELQNKADELAAKLPTSPEIEALEQEQQALMNRMKEQGHEKVDVEQEIVSLEKELHRLEKELSDAKEGAMQQVPLLKNSLSLYATISGIKWDFSHKSRSKLCGTIANPDSGVAMEFSLDESKLSSFQLANQLWDMIEVPQKN